MASRNDADLASAATDNEARKIVDSGKRDKRSSKPSPNESQAAIRSELSGSAASALGRRGVAPVLALDRRSIAAGFNPATPLQVRRNDNLCIRVRSVGADHTSAGGRQWLTFSPS